MRSLLIGISISICFAFHPGKVQAQALDELLEMLDKEYEAENAFHTTEYVAQFWRLAGNPGFDSSIYRVESILQAAGYLKDVPDARLSYRIEKYPLRGPVWEPQDAELFIEGEDEALLSFKTNRNMLAINSFSTPEKGISAEVIYVKNCGGKSLDSLDLKGKIVYATCGTGRLFGEAVLSRGALGVVTYGIPFYNRPEKHPTSISFGGIPYNEKKASFGIKLSLAAKERLDNALQKGKTKLKVYIKSRFVEAPELTLIAEIKGKKHSEERFVFSAHVQEPGANDNASGVGAQAEMARTVAALVQAGKVDPDRTLTFLWGDEIRSTNRYIEQDMERAKDIKWGISLDMVGEDTEKTGGTFLIEKMPDPSAIWTRGEDKHTEWGASKVFESTFNPHYFNDLIEYICRQRAKSNGWVVNTNPFEGGSDHQPFLDARIPGLLLWHFTDVYYHTDGDLIDKVSAQTLKNVGVSSLASAFFLLQEEEDRAFDILKIVEDAALKRIAVEGELSRKEVSNGSPVYEEREILWAWGYWYSRLIPTVSDVLSGKANGLLKSEIRKSLKKVGDAVISEMGNLE
ncbi:MAG: M28 family peptidase [Bacteroidota bacterium]